LKYRLLIELRLTHQYYRDGRCPDLLLEPTDATVCLLRNHRCILKSAPDTVRILTEVNETNEPVIPLSLGSTLAFHLRVGNPEFALFTDLAGLHDKSDPVFTNASKHSSGGRLDVISRTHWQEDRFTVRQPLEKAAFTLQGRPLLNLNPLDFAVTGSEAVTQVAAYDPAGKVITVDARGAEPDARFTVRYQVLPPLRRGVLADVEIQIDETLPGPGEGTAEFEIAFPAKQLRWAYYCVTNLNGLRNTVEIVDAAANETRAIRFSGTPLDQDSGRQDEIARSLAEQYPEMKRYRFISDETVPCRQTPRASLRLQVAGQDPSPAALISALPNPALRNLTSFVLGDQAVRQEALFQIVKYLPHSFPTSRGST